MNSRDRDFFEACLGDTVDVAEEIMDRHASRHPTRRRNNAVRARLGASRLDPERERRATGNAGFDRSTATAVALAESLGRRFACRNPEQGDEARLVVIGHYPA